MYTALLRDSLIASSAAGRWKRLGEGARLEQINWARDTNGIYVEEEFAHKSQGQASDHDSTKNTSNRNCMCLEMDTPLKTTTHNTKLNTPATAHVTVRPMMLYTPFRYMLPVPSTA